jgi:hypothetical protein
MIQLSTGIRRGSAFQNGKETSFIRVLFKDQALAHEYCFCWGNQDETRVTRVDLKLKLRRRNG